MNRRITRGNLYTQVFEDIYDKIIDGSYTVGELLPSETKLQEEYGVSRITIRKAMDELQASGFIEKHPGIGTLVSSNKRVIDLKRIDSFSHENEKESSNLVSFQTIKPSRRVRLKLSLSSTDTVYQIDRIRKVNKKIIGFHRAFVPTKYIDLEQADFETESASLYSLFNQNDIYLTNGVETIEAINITDEIQNYLNVPNNFPILFKERVSYSHNKVIEFVEIYYRGDMYKYHVELNNLD